MEPSLLENRKSSLSIRNSINLHPQALSRFSTAFAPLLHRFIAANPQANPQIFRAFSACFAHAVVRRIFRSVCAAISQELASSAAKKNGERAANQRSCGKLGLGQLRTKNGERFPLIHVEQLVRAVRSGAAEFSTLWIDLTGAVAPGGVMQRHQRRSRAQKIL